jgi:divalent metal cation (Fe/Co/Zn/Cd) transporter
VVLAAKVHPSGDLSVEALARAMDELDARLRSELPEVGEVFIDVTQHSGRDSSD